MPDSHQRPIVVGVDGSANGDRALDWAAHLAARARRPLRVVHVPEAGLLARFIFAPGKDSLGDLARELVDNRVARAREAAADLAVSGEVRPGSRDLCLTEESRRAHLMVVGFHGFGGVESLVTGSATAQLASRAACPVVAVPPDAPRNEVARVTVGTDASRASRPAVSWAFDLARLWRARLRIVLAWESSAFAWPEEHDEGWPADQEPSLDQARARISGFLTAKEAEYPDVPVEREVVPGAALPVLVAESDRADLLVVGSHGHGQGIMETLMDLGSVTRGVLRHAHCPVAVVPGRPGNPPTG